MVKPKQVTQAKKNLKNEISSESTKLVLNFKKASSLNMEVYAQEREKLINETAYYLAEARDFIPGFDIKDWLDAEKQIDAMPGSS